MRRERMLGYYPNAIKSILEFNAIIDAEFPEIDDVETNKELVISDAYLATMSERRIVQWEKKFGIQPPKDATLDSRRDSITARVRGQGKLNTESINRIVSAFTGNGCKCWVEDSTLRVALLPFDESKLSLSQAIQLVERELLLKLPAHLNLSVEYAYEYWGDVNDQNANWTLVKVTHKTWEDVLYGRQGKPNMLDSSELDDFYLG